MLNKCPLVLWLVLMSTDLLVELQFTRMAHFRRGVKEMGLDLFRSSLLLSFPKTWYSAWNMPIFFKIFILINNQTENIHTEMGRLYR